jgi:hypothetical protein
MNLLEATRAHCPVATLIFLSTSKVYSDRPNHLPLMESNISMLEAIELCHEIAGREIDYELSDEPRIGDHRWYVSDVSSFADYPGWRLSLGIEQGLREIHDLNREQWTAVKPEPTAKS